MRLMQITVADAGSEALDRFRCRARMTSHVRVIRVGPVVRRGPIGDAVIATIGMVNSDVELLDLVAGLAGPAELAQ